MDVDGQGLNTEQWHAIFGVVLAELRASAGRDATELPPPVLFHDAEHVTDQSGEGRLICEEGR
ncbi:MAG: hypothetical protein JWO79_1268 [Actinomycetia bacterium]|nr:hypothetical protein [Actinomycetes bacterium]